MKRSAIRCWLFSALLLVIILSFSFGLAVLSEASAQETFERFTDFWESEIAGLVFTNLTLLLGLLIFALYLLTTKLSVAIGLVGIPYYACHLINAFKITFRNEPFYPWDISLAGEAATIAGSMKLEFTPPMIWGAVLLLGGLILAILADIFWLKKIRPRYRFGLISGLVTLGIFMGSFFGLTDYSYLVDHGVEVLIYDQIPSYRKNGFVYAFIANAYDSKIDPPADYSPDTVAAVASDYRKEDAKEKPNVIIVMSEAFSDIWNAQNLTFKEEVAPNFTALSEEYLSGSCLTSEYGGNTSNCEFEVLTGYSTFLLPTGTVPYMNYLNTETDSYVSFLNSQGYYTVALHPYLRSFFSREKAYGLLGFDDFYSEEHFEGASRERMMQYVSDDAVVDRIIAEYEKNEETDRPFFCHTVTMQNHASYFAEDWPAEEMIGFSADCALNDEEYNTLMSFATGIHSADAALGRLVEYFEKVKEPTVLLFFGDHQPSLYGDSRELMERIGYTADRNSAEGLAALQSTPYLIWNNFEKEPTHAQEDMSMFHLLPYMTRTLKLARPAYHAYMDSLYQEVRAVTRKVCLDSEGAAMEVLPRQGQEKFEEYLMLVYDGLIGKQYGNLFLYPQ